MMIQSQLRLFAAFLTTIGLACQIEAAEATGPARDLEQLLRREHEVYAIHRVLSSDPKAMDVIRTTAAVLRTHRPADPRILERIGQALRMAADDVEQRIKSGEKLDALKEYMASGRRNLVKEFPHGTVSEVAMRAFQQSLLQGTVDLPQPKMLFHSGARALRMEEVRHWLSWGDTEEMTGKSASYTLWRTLVTSQTGLQFPAEPTTEAFLLSNSDYARQPFTTTLIESDRLLRTWKDRMADPALQKEATRDLIEGLTTLARTSNETLGPQFRDLDFAMALARRRQRDGAADRNGAAAFSEMENVWGFSEQELVRQMELRVRHEETLAMLDSAASVISSLGMVVGDPEFTFAAQRLASYFQIVNNAERLRYATAATGFGQAAITMNYVALALQFVSLFSPGSGSGSDEVVLKYLAEIHKEIRIGFHEMGKQQMQMRIELNEGFSQIGEALQQLIRGQRISGVQLDDLQDRLIELKTYLDLIVRENWEIERQRVQDAFEGHRQHYVQGPIEVGRPLPLEEARHGLSQFVTSATTDADNIGCIGPVSLLTYTGHGVDFRNAASHIRALGRYESVDLLLRLEEVVAGVSNPIGREERIASAVHWAQACEAYLNVWGQLSEVNQAQLSPDVQLGRLHDMGWRIRAALEDGSSPERLAAIIQYRKYVYDECVRLLNEECKRYQDTHLLGLPDDGTVQQAVLQSVAKDPERFAERVDRFVPDTATPLLMGGYPTSVAIPGERQSLEYGLQYQFGEYNTLTPAVAMQMVSPLARAWIALRNLNGVKTPLEMVGYRKWEYIDSIDRKGHRDVFKYVYVRPSVKFRLVIDHSISSGTLRADQQTAKTTRQNGVTALSVGLFDYPDEKDNTTLVAIGWPKDRRGSLVNALGVAPDNALNDRAVWERLLTNSEPNIRVTQPSAAADENLAAKVHDDVLRLRNRFLVEAHKAINDSSGKLATQTTLANSDAMRQLSRQLAWLDVIHEVLDQHVSVFLPELNEDRALLIHLPGRAHLAEVLSVLASPELPTMTAIRRRIGEQDKNGDERISFGEADNALKPRFRDIDRNNDGFVELAECTPKTIAAVVAHLEEISARHEHCLTTFLAKLDTSRRELSDNEGGTDNTEIPERFRLVDKTLVDLVNARYFEAKTK